MSFVLPGVKVRNLFNINEPASSVTRQPAENKRGSCGQGGNSGERKPTINAKIINVHNARHICLRGHRAPYP